MKINLKLSLCGTMVCFFGTVLGGTLECYGPAESSAGDAIAFCLQNAYAYPQHPICAIHADGSDVRQVTNAICPAGAINPTWRPRLSGPYLGESPPGLTPVPFAPTQIPSSGIFGFGFSPDGLECFYGHYPDIMTTQETDGDWPSPMVASFSGTYGDIEPHISPDGQRVYFGSERPPATSETDSRLWYVDKSDTGWSAARLIEPPLQEIPVMYPSVASNGNLYFTANPGAGGYIALSRYIDGAYQPPERLSSNVNISGMPAHPFIAPDESYLILDASTNGYLRDLFICFRKPDGSWTKAANLGSPVNTPSGSELCPFVSRDGKYFFFSRGGTEYWVDASVISGLRPVEMIETELAPGALGCPYADTLEVMSGTGASPFEWSVTSGFLPAGLTLGGASGIISGEPLEAGTYRFTIQVTDAREASDSSFFDLNINPHQDEKGDANADCTINVLDVLTVVNIILDLRVPDEGELWRADCNGIACDGDGTINVLDALTVVNIILGTAQCP